MQRKVTTIREVADAPNVHPALFKVLLIVDDTALSAMLHSVITSRGFECEPISFGNHVPDAIAESKADLLLVDNDCCAPDSIRRLRSSCGLPIILLLSEENLPYLDFTSGIIDFAMKSCNATELAARINQALWHVSNIDSSNLIKHGDLIIDLTKYEVSIAGRVINLSFKEYELLQVLIRNKGRVLTRQVLLDKVWGYDYYGGDRTVDVHIRRLRSKIEDADHAFIETVRNVGYRFSTS